MKGNGNTRASGSSAPRATSLSKAGASVNGITTIPSNVDPNVARLMEANPTGVSGKPDWMSNEQAYAETFQTKVERSNITGEQADKSLKALNKEANALKKELDGVDKRAFESEGIPFPDKFNRMKINERKETMQKLGYNPKNNNEAWSQYREVRQRAVDKINAYPNYDKKRLALSQMRGMAHALSAKASAYHYSKNK